MNIVKLQAENIKRIVAVEIKPDGALVQITGRNGAGKSSVLDAIWWALAGERSHQSAPIRKGADTARIKLDLGEVVVTRHFAKREDDSVVTRITVENAEGARFPSPQKMLDSLLGSLAFDPLAFAAGVRPRAGRAVGRAVRRRHGGHRAGAPWRLRTAARLQPGRETEARGGRADHRPGRHAGCRDQRWRAGEADPRR